MSNDGVQVTVQSDLLVFVEECDTIEVLPSAEAPIVVTIEEEGVDVVLLDDSPVVMLFDEDPIETVFAESELIILEVGGTPTTLPLTTVGDLLGFDGSNDRFPVGADGFILIADAAEAFGFRWAAQPVASPLTTKGDVYTFDVADQRLPVGTDGQVLSADSVEATGLAWAAPVAKPTAIEVENPSGSERIIWFRTYVETTVLEITAVLNGSASPSVTFSVRFDADRSAVGTELLTGGRVLTNTTTGVSLVPDVTTIPADRWVWLQTTAQSGTVLDLLVGMELSP